MFKSHGNSCQRRPAVVKISVARGRRVNQRLVILLAVLTFVAPVAIGEEPALGPQAAEPGHASVSSPKLHVHELDLLSVIENISRKSGKIIIPDDNLLPQLKNRKAVIVLPPEFDLAKEAGSELWQSVLEQVLPLYGYTVVEKDGILRLIPLQEANRLPLPIYDDGIEKRPLDSERYVVAVVRLKHVTIDILRPFFENISTVRPPIPLRDNKTLVVTAAESDIKAFLDLVALLDVPEEEPKIQIYQFNHSDASQARGHIMAFLALERAREGAAVSLSDQAFILPDDRTNRLLVSAVAKDHLLVQEFIDFLDANAENEKTNIHVLRLQNSKAKALAENLNRLLRADSPATAPEKEASQKNREPSSPLPAGARVVAVADQNALLVWAEPREFAEINDAVKILDASPARATCPFTCRPFWIFLTGLFVGIAGLWMLRRCKASKKGAP